jgi:hypothetical protein
MTDQTLMVRFVKYFKTSFNLFHVSEQSIAITNINVLPSIGEESVEQEQKIHSDDTAKIRKGFFLIIIL